MDLFLRFFFGAALGSFLNVIALRYDPDRFILGAHTVGGRSYCPHCKRTLRWFELVPLVSFIMQGARCRSCKAKISPQYFIVEVICGLLFVLVPATVSCSALLTAHCSLLTVLWVLVFLTLLLISLIDLRLMMIPDELNVALGALGFVLSFTGSPDIAERIFAALGAGFFFGALVVATRGRGMGVGDVKLAAALGFVLGGAFVTLTIAVSFILGAAVGVALIAFQKGSMKTAIPFGPFLALGALLVFIWGGMAADLFALNLLMLPW